MNLQNSSKSSPESRPNPIFVMGITERSGTTFLFDLLTIHPDCLSVQERVPEDFFVSKAGFLQRYVDALFLEWEHWKTLDQSQRCFLLECIGNGLISFLTAEKHFQKHVLTKTPSVVGIGNFFELFPNAYLIILVRDGRAVVESGIKSFDWDFRPAVRTWAKAAKAILEFDKIYKASKFKYRIVRYEDLYNNTFEQIKHLLDFLELDTSVYDFNAVKNLPVRGSSQLSKDFNGKVHWSPVEKNRYFKPLERWAGWNDQMHARFNRIAANYLRQFGYEPRDYQANELLWALWDSIVEKKETFKQLLKTFILTIKFRRRQK